MRRRDSFDDFGVQLAGWVIVIIPLTAIAALVEWLRS